MPRDSLSTANYRAVIEDLRARRDRLDSLIKSLEEVSGEELVAPQIGAPTLTENPKPAFSLVGDTGKQVNIGEACIRILRANGGFMTNQQILAELTTRGYQLLTTNPANNVSSALYTRSNSKKDVVRVDSRHWRYVSPKSEQNVASSSVLGAQATH